MTWQNVFTFTDSYQNFLLENIKKHV